MWISVILKPTALILLAVIHVPVSLDTKEMDLSVLVSAICMRACISQL